MLRIRLHQFRCWDDITIEAPIGQITLIRGPSGGGKSTIFHAITYCLYGNVRMITPNKVEHANTQVSMEFPYVLDNIPGILKLERQKGKNRFIVIHVSSAQNVRTYEDKVGQALVDELFGKYDIWLASCYIGQGCRNSFLTAPNAGKMEFLNSIAFHEENPTEYIECLDRVITISDSDYKTKTALYTEANNNFTKNSQQLATLIAATDMTKYLTEEQIAYVKNTINNKQQELLDLQKQKIKNDNETAVLRNLQQQLVTTTANLESLTINQPDTSLITRCIQFNINNLQDNETTERNIQNLFEIIQLLYRRDDLEKEIFKYNNNVANANYTMNDYSEALEKEGIYRDNQRLAQSLGVTYDAVAINNLITKYRTLLNLQNRIHIEKLYEVADRKLQSLVLPNWQPLVFPDVISQTIPAPDLTIYNTTSHRQQLTELSAKIGEIQTQIKHLEKGRDVLQCPNCKVHLRHPHNGLVLADDAPLNVTELQNAMTELEHIKKQMLELQQTITRLGNEENSARINYEKAVANEQKRIENLREQVRQLQLEQQRRAAVTADYERQRNEIQAQLAEYTKELEKYPAISDVQIEKKLLTSTEIERLHGVIAQLNNMVFVKPPEVSSAVIRTVLEQQEIAQRRIVALEALRQHTERIPVIYQGVKADILQQLIRDIRNYQQQTRLVTEERNRLLKLQQSLQQQIDERPIIIDVTESIVKITNELEDWRNALLLANKANDVMMQRNTLIKDQEAMLKQYNDLTNMAAELANLYNLRKIAVETECKVLQDVVDSINICIESVCSTLFDDITINLSLFKTMKTSGNVKPVVNFNIAYNGGSYDNINQMSGGEGDRASLALTLALNRLSSCPILMLDECLASLDMSAKEQAIRTIRENSTNTVLLIMHDGVEGHFDNVINVEELRQNMVKIK